MDSVKAKILVIGPKMGGKTRVANTLAKMPDFSGADYAAPYKPTKGVRILEFDESVQAGRRSVQLAVELWDCSGDEQYASCWPAILHEAQGVVLVYDPTVKEQEKQAERWYKSYVQSRLGLKDQQVLLLAHQAQSGGARGGYQAPHSMDRFRFLNTSLDGEDAIAQLRQTFSDFCSDVAAAASEKASADMDASLQMAMR